MSRAMSLSFYAQKWKTNFIAHP